MYYRYFRQLEEVKLLKERYRRNTSSISQDECSKLHEFNVCVIGCGGLGGYIIEMLARIGIGTLTIVDMDKFDETNLNRQILSRESNIGEYKVIVAKERIKDINSDVRIIDFNEKFSEINGDKIIKNSEIGRAHV